MKRTREDSEYTRQRLLDAGLQVFRRKGYADTRLEDIAEEAGVTRGAIYHHFGGKVELYEALVEERFARANERVAQLTAAGGSPRQIIRRLLVGMLTYLYEDADYRVVQELVLFKTAFVPELAASMQRKVESLRAQRNYLSDLVTQGIAAGEFRPDLDAGEAAEAILGLVSGVSINWLMDGQGAASGAHAVGIVDALLCGLDAGPGA